MLAWRVTISWPGLQNQSSLFTEKPSQVLLLHANNCFFAPKVSERNDQISGLEQVGGEQMDPSDRLCHPQSEIMVERQMAPTFFCSFPARMQSQFQ
jgi:hypothetical protein